MGAHFLGSVFCYKTIIPDAEAHPFASSACLPHAVVRWIRAYVAPWVHQGIGCTGVLNFDQIEEMKDRVTERIDSALIANWKLHNVITQEDIEDAVREMAGIVDEQNANNPAHIAMTDTQEKRDNLMKDPA